MIHPGTNDRFVATMEQVLDVYKRPYARKYPVVCMDESPKQLIRETRTPIAMGRGRQLVAILNMSAAGYVIYLWQTNHWEERGM